MCDDYHEIHCNNCYNIKSCIKKQSLNLKNKVLNICPLILCDHKCNTKFHECKKDEHLILCPKVKVPCLNVEYGCPFYVVREKLGQHLYRCPASVVVCTVDWNRKPLLPGTSQPFIHNPIHLDVAALNCDINTLRDFQSSLPISLRSVLKTSKNKYPIMPLGVSGHRIPQSILAQAELEGNQSDESEEESMSYEYATPKSPPGLQESVCNQLVGPSNEKNNNLTTGKHVKKSSCELSLTIDVITKHSGRHLNWFTFMCAKEFRRDEYGNHFKNLHGDIYTGLNGWLFRRCPMACYGCDFGIEHMYPKLEKNSNKGYRIRYNQDLETFCFTQQSDDSNPVIPSAEERIHQDNTEKKNFCDLPFEILLKLTEYLDPLSLNALSMTNLKLREACSARVYSRGIVVLNWEKDLQNGAWNVAGKNWMFSSSFSCIESWEFGDPGRLSSHLAKCSYYQSQMHRPLHPFSYPVKEDDL